VLKAFGFQAKKVLKDFVLQEIYVLKAFGHQATCQGPF
jgi:hypothetical protein